MIFIELSQCLFCIHVNYDSNLSIIWNKQIFWFRIYFSNLFSVFLMLPYLNRWLIFLYFVKSDKWIISAYCYYFLWMMETNWILNIPLYTMVGFLKLWSTYISYNLFKLFPASVISNINKFWFAEQTNN